MELMLPLFFLGCICLSLATDESGYVINGNDVTEDGKWPWQGSLRAWGGHSCGVTLLSAKWGLTAAHCVEFEKSAYAFTFGTNDRYSGGLTANASQIILHEEYGKGSGFFPNDIAVVEFDRSVSGAHIGSVPLALKGSEHSDNTDCWITGWGYVVPGTSMPVIMQEAKVDVITNAKCKEAWGSFLLNDGHVCTGMDASTSCEGDSGGPLVCKVDGRYELVGITSWGPAGCITSHPAASSRVAYFRDWIRTKTGI